VQRSFVKRIRGDTVEGRHLSAIQLTTAAGIVAVLELFARGSLEKSFVKQESITFEQFVSTRWGSRVYGDDPWKSPKGDEPLQR
jgi:saccharopine dehydrogenase-like NADP-dependent oxidoreductase